MKRGPGNPIPQESRDLVERRQHGLCFRCGGRGYEDHHRRRRRERRHDSHCPCNLVRLCRTCHSWAHMNPTAARGVGLILESSMLEPYEMPVRAPDGPWMLHCDGSATPLTEAQVMMIGSSLHIDM